MHSRPLDFDDLPPAMEFADNLHADAALDVPRLRETMVLLADNPLALLDRGPPDPDTNESHNLPLPDFDELASSVVVP